jgi:Tfp pilus assembly protein PilF
VSTVLDALRRSRADRPPAADTPRTARTDAVLAALGRPRSTSGGQARTVVLWVVAAVIVAVAVVSVILMRAPSAPRPVSPSAGRATPVTPRPLTQPPTAVRSNEPVVSVPTDPREAAPPDTPAPASIATMRGRAAAPASNRSAAPPASASPSGALTSSTRPVAPRAAPVRVTLNPRAVQASAVRPSVPSADQATAAPPVPVKPAAPIPNRFALALYYQRIGDFDNALVQYRTLLDLNDADAEVHNNLGLLYQDHGQVNDGVRQFRQAIAIDPTYVKAHNNLGVALMRSNQLGAAALELRVALGLNPRNVESLVNLALVEKATGRTADARDLLRRAVTIDPRNAGSHYNLAVVADESGDITTAIEHYRAFLRFGTVTHPDLAAQVRARLTALGG